MNLLRKNLLASAAVVSAALAMNPLAARATNYVVNGDFEDSSPVNTTTYPTSTGGIGQIGPIVSLPSWLTECLQNCSDGGVGSGGFAFVLNEDADNRSAANPAYPNQGGGFPSLNSPSAGTNIFVWGPDFYGPGTSTVGGANTISGPILNGFTTSSNGGKFVGIDGDYGRAKIKQTVSGLTPGDPYTLSFEYAGSQFTDAAGATSQEWRVSYNGTSSVVNWSVPSTWFKSWQTQTYNFIAASSGFDLVFEAYGRGVDDLSGLPPFLLLDNVQILDPTTPPPPPPGTSVPGPLPILGAGLSLAWSRKLRRRLALYS